MFARNQTGINPQNMSNKKWVKGQIHAILSLRQFIGGTAFHLGEKAPLPVPVWSIPFFVCLFVLFNCFLPQRRTLHNTCLLLFGRSASTSFSAVPKNSGHHLHRWKRRRSFLWSTVTYQPIHYFSRHAFHDDLNWTSGACLTLPLSSHMNILQQTVNSSVINTVVSTGAQPPCISCNLALNCTAC